MPSEPGKLGRDPQQKSLAEFTDVKLPEWSFSLPRQRARNKRARSIVGVPRPFLKWAGGKRQLIKQLHPYIPREFNKYIEPFVGGGAMFFYLIPDKAFLMDINPDLINTYQAIKSDVHELVKSLKKHENDEAYFYKIRDAERDMGEFRSWSSVEKASRIIYMNHACFNGLYRVNSQGFFNVAFGAYEDPLICDERNLLAVHDALKDVDLRVASFETCLEIASRDDFVYLDPPYVPVSETANFTSYTKDNFTREDQKRLLDVVRELDRRGCKVMISNSYSKFVVDLFDGYHIKTIMANRAINRDGSKRGKIKELVIMNDYTR